MLMSMYVSACVSVSMGGSVCVCVCLFPCRHFCVCVFCVYVCVCAYVKSDADGGGARWAALGGSGLPVLELWEGLSYGRSDNVGLCSFFFF